MSTIRKEEKFTLGMIITGIVIIGILISILIIFFINTRKVKNNTEFSQEIDFIGEINNDDTEYEEVSINIGKTVKEANNEKKEQEVEKAKEDVVKEKTINRNKEKSNQNNVETNTSIENVVHESKKEISFLAPLKGEIIREFAKESLVYSETLQEWITHNGVDIKADKTSVVTSAYDGKISAIKNDPRYGLTVIITHEDGYKTVYANLLTAEFVVEGEEVKAGQTIGTVGNTASFEILDDYHLHFELIKDDEYLNPTNLIQF